MLGFLGTFSVNFEIPDYWGIVKSVLRGFGTIPNFPELLKQLKLLERLKLLEQFNLL